MSTENYVPKKGEYFTVVCWKKQHDFSYIGDCLEAMASDGDLVRCRRHPQPDYISGFTLSAAMVQMRPLSADFVSSIVTNRRTHA